ncbi:hypothetical protein ACEQ8H_005708 [Pleosporales sp. CAS-2024a]
METPFQVWAGNLGEQGNRRSDPDSHSTHSSDECENPDEDCDSNLVTEESENERLDLSEAEELFESVKDSIASLFRLAVIIRNSSPRDRYTRALGGHDPFMEHFDVLDVGEKFPKLQRESNKWLRDGLSKAVAQRRQYLRYAREHGYKPGKEPVELWKPAMESPKASQPIQAESQSDENDQQ